MPDSPFEACHKGDAFSPAFNALLLSCLMHNPRDLEKGCSVAPRSCSSSTDDVCVETGG